MRQRLGVLVLRQGVDRPELLAPAPKALQLALDLLALLVARGLRSRDQGPAEPLRDPASSAAASSRRSRSWVAPTSAWVTASAAPRSSACSSASRREQTAQLLGDVVGGLIAAEELRARAPAVRSPTASRAAAVAVGDSLSAASSRLLRLQPALQRVLDGRGRAAPRRAGRRARRARRPREPGRAPSSARVCVGALAARDPARPSPPRARRRPRAAPPRADRDSVPVVGGLVRRAHRGSTRRRSIPAARSARRDESASARTASRSCAARNAVSRPQTSVRSRSRAASRSSIAVRSPVDLGELRLDRVALLARGARVALAAREDVVVGAKLLREQPGAELHRLAPRGGRGSRPPAPVASAAAAAAGASRSTSSARSRLSWVRSSLSWARRRRLRCLPRPAASSTRSRRWRGFEWTISSTRPWLITECISRPRLVSASASTTSASRQRAPFSQ